MNTVRSQEGNVILLVVLLVQFFVIGGLGYYAYTLKTAAPPVEAAVSAPATSKTDAPIIPESKQLTPTQSQTQADTSDNPFDDTQTSYQNPFSNLQ